MDDAQPISERVNRWQGLLESLPFLSDNKAASKRVRNTLPLGGTAIIPYRAKIKPPVELVAGDCAHSKRHGVGKGIG